MNIEHGQLIEEEKTEKPKHSPKIYFFVLAILALLATNAYYAIRYKNLGKQVEVLNSDKSQLEFEVDRIEAELNRITGENIDLAAELKEQHDSARALIADLRNKLQERPTINDSDLLITQQTIDKLRDLVERYRVDIETLRKDNLALAKERDELESSVRAVNNQISRLQRSNQDLEERIQTASFLKISEITINALRQRGGERLTQESKARRADQLQISFTIANNTLAPEGDYTIYLRLTEPSGNLITDGKVFKINEEEIQYTDVSKISFKNNGQQYVINWSPSNYSFQKGTYTVILYTKNSIMGRASMTLT